LIKLPRFLGPEKMTSPVFFEEKKQWKKGESDLAFVAIEDRK